MADTVYFVRFFRRNGDDLVAASLIEASDTVAAIGEALRHVQEDAVGAIVFGTISGKGTSNWSDLEIIIRIGEVPDEMAAVLSPKSG
jgi:hypothetical protein